MRTCRWCAKELPHRTEKGHREREYCNAPCRQRAHRSRKQWEHDAQVRSLQVENRTLKGDAEWAQGQFWEQQHQLEMQHHQIAAQAAKIAERSSRLERYAKRR